MTTPEPLPWTKMCSGCGSTWTDKRLASERLIRPGLISCCPERRMIDIMPVPDVDAGVPVAAVVPDELDVTEARALLARPPAKLNSLELLGGLSIALRRIDWLETAIAVGRGQWHAAHDRHVERYRAISARLLEAMLVVHPVEIIAIYDNRGTPAEHNGDTQFVTISDIQAILTRMEADLREVMGLPGLAAFMPTGIQPGGIAPVHPSASEEAPTGNRPVCRCGWVNGDHRTSCRNCNTPLGPIARPHA